MFVDVVVNDEGNAQKYYLWIDTPPGETARISPLFSTKEDVEKWARDEHVFETNPQKHAGRLKGIGGAVWHTITALNGETRYWCGNWDRRTPVELFLECNSIIQDLLNNHPDLIKDLHETVFVRDNGTVESDRKENQPTPHPSAGT